MSPTQRTLAECRKRGWPAWVVEQTIPRTFIKRDMFGFIDIVAITPTETIGIQATSGANHAARMAKARRQPHFAAWLAAGRTFAVWSWSKRGERGKRKTWQLRATSVSHVPRETEISPAIRASAELDAIGGSYVGVT